MMKGYGQPERSELDPGTDRVGQGRDTGLEEPMQQLSFGGGGDAGSGGDAGGSAGGESSYPERPDEPNCIYYMRTGFCGYGERCRFNHPRDRRLAYGGGTAGGEDYPERDGQPVCQYYMRTRSCKFGPSCKYHHPRHEAASATSVALNICGYPLRLGEKECSYYMRTGQCNFGVTCKFHHPQPANVQVPVATSIASAAPVPANVAAHIVYSTVQSPAAPPQQYGVVAGSWQVASPPMVPSSYIQGPYGPMLLPTGAVPVAGWTPYPASFSAVPAPSTQSTIGAAQLYGLPSMTVMAPPYTGSYPPISSSPGPSSSVQEEQSYPKRPGQPECQHYLRTGECKYGLSCKYHHPAERIAQKANFTLSPMGLPLRPGAHICTYFLQRGVCKYGPTCKFDHPMGSLSYSSFASSLSDMPVAPHPMGSSIAALAPSSSWSDIRNEVSGSINSSTKVGSSPSSASGTVLSMSSSVPQSGTQDPNQSFTKSASPSSKSDQGDDVRASS